MKWPKGGAPNAFAARRAAGSGRFTPEPLGSADFSRRRMKPETQTPALEGATGPS